MKIYFSAPRNTPYQYAFVEECVEKLRAAGFDVFTGNDKYINQQAAFEVTTEVDGQPVYSDENRAGRLVKSAYACEVFEENYSQLAGADALVALLDGSQVDDRVASEIGIFYGLMLNGSGQKGILGYATDARCLRRRDSTYGVNIFTVGTLEEVGQVFEDFGQLIKALQAWDK